MYFPKIEKLEKKDEKGPYDEIVDWFYSNGAFNLEDDFTDKEYLEALNAIPTLEALVIDHVKDLPKKDVSFMKELVLWALVEYEKLSKNRFTKGMLFQDPYGNLIKGL